MFAKLIRLEFKSFFRSPQLGAGILMKIGMFFIFAYMALIFFGGAFALFFGARKEGVNPLILFSRFFLVYWVLDLLLKYFMQQLPANNIKPLLTLNIPKKERQAVFAAIPEAMIAFREENHSLEKYTALAIGPGLGTDKSAERKVASLLESTKLPIVLDADALTVLDNNPKLFSKIPPNSIVTPHEKEFDRMFGQHLNNQDRQQTANQKAAEYHCIIVLKSSQTFITNGNQSFQNSTGNAGLAKGGSGDALTGMITAFTAQGYEPLQAACLGVFLHGLAADITLETQSEESMLISDVIENIGKAFRKI